MLQIKTRADWGAQAPKGKVALGENVSDWYIHWNGPPVPPGPTDRYLRSVQNYHQNTKGWSDIAYNFAVDQDGVVWTLRGFNVQGGATKYANRTSRALLFCIGEGQKPSLAALNSASQLIARGPRGGKVQPHRHAPEANTRCPGPALTTWARNFIHQPPQETAMTREEAEIYVEEAYAKLLGRKGDAGGITYWTEQLVSKEVTKGQMDKFFLITALQELRNQPQIPFPDVDLDDRVRRAVGAALRRAGDTLD